MITAKEFLASEQAKKLPDWIRKDPNWDYHPTIDKVFPRLGLQNCREPCAEEIIDLGTPTPTSKKMDIVFSSDGIEGLWDIATMSMRGVMTCKHWDNPHSKSIVGEITSPRIGIIYLTDGTMTEYGLSINKRCRVIHSIFHESGRDCIYLDALYAKTTNTNPMVYENKDPNYKMIKAIFKKFLESKLTSNTVVSL